MANYEINSRSLMPYIGSEAHRSYLARREEIGKAFEILDEVHRLPLRDMCEEILRRDAERAARKEQGLTDDEEIFEEQEPETLEFARHLESIFPFVVNAPEEDRPDYATGLLDYLDAKKKLQ